MDMRNITNDVCRAFEAREKFSRSNSSTDGTTMYLHGNAIAKWDENDNLWVTNAGWSSNTTKERLDGLRGVSIYQKNFDWYLNGKVWDGEWVNVRNFN